MRRGGAKYGRSGPRACERASSSSPFQTPTPDDSGDEKERDRERLRDPPASGGAGGGCKAGGAQTAPRSLLPPLPRCDSRASSQSESENDGAGGGGRPGSRLSQGSGVSFAGSEIELELCATDCASYLAL